MVELKILTVLRGDKDIIVEDEENPEERNNLWGIVKDLLKRGYTVFLNEGKGEAARITGYDPELHEWQIVGGQQGKKKVPAKGTRAEVVAPSAGG